MTVSHVNDTRLTLPALLGWVAALAGIVAIFTTYWDEAWHTDVGRDTFWSAPHVLLYGSVAIAGLAVAIWGIRALIATRSLRAVLGNGPLILAGAAGAMVLVAAPIDGVWHAAYGRDAVLWSPPHMLAILGSTALLLAVLAGLPEDGALLRAAVGVLLLANGVAVVFEYEAGVPQFSEVLYLPVLLSAGVLLAHLVRVHVPLRAPVTAVVAGYALLRLGIAAGLAILDRSTPDLPIAVLGFAAFDLPLRSTLQRYAAAAVAVAGLAWGASSTGLASPVAEEVGTAAVPIIVLGAVALLLRWRGGRRLAAAGVVVTGIGLVVMAPAKPAEAHDPGQGEPVSDVTMTVKTSGTGEVLLELVVPPEHCDDLAPSRVVARRAGDTIVGTLDHVGTCRFKGTIELPAHGRWFVYGEMSHGGIDVEAWLPVFPEQRADVSEVRTLYVPAGADSHVPASQLLAGAAIYGAGVGLLGFGIAATGKRRWATERWPEAS